jgi:hypothetical protein
VIRNGLRVASVPEEEFEQAVESEDPPTLIAEHSEQKPTAHPKGPMPSTRRKF